MLQLKTKEAHTKVFHNGNYIGRFMTKRAEDKKVWCFYPSHQTQERIKAQTRREMIRRLANGFNRQNTRACSNRDIAA